MNARPASDFDLQTLSRVWNATYEGYFVPVAFSPAVLELHFAMGSVDLDRSLVWWEGDEAVGLSILGRRGERGWIGGFGITPPFRGRGLSYDLFAEHVRLCDSIGLRSVQLEVIVENWARKVYERTGLEVTRRVSVVEGVLTPHTATRAEQIPPQLALELLGERRRPFPPDWKREIAALRADPSPKAALLLGPPYDPDGALLYRTAGERLLILDAVARDDAAARELVLGLAHAVGSRPVRIVNEPPDSPMHRALLDADCTVPVEQFEMVRRGGAARTVDGGP